MQMRLIVVVSILAVVGAACGGKTESGKTPVQLSGAVNNHGTKDLSAKGQSLEFELEQDDFYFEPTFIKSIAGAKVKAEIKNEGKTSHTFTIESLGVDVELSPGMKKEVEFILPGSGAVNFICRFHRSQGMQGSFFFERS